MYYLYLYMLYIYIYIYHNTYIYPDTVSAAAGATQCSCSAPRRFFQNVKSWVLLAAHATLFVPHCWILLFAGPLGKTAVVIITVLVGPSKYQIRRPIGFEREEHLPYFRFPRFPFFLSSELSKHLEGTFTAAARTT